MDIMSDTTRRIGQEVVLNALPTQAGQPRIGTHGHITNIGHSGIPNPIQVTFDDDKSTIRYYSTTQFAAWFALIK